MLVGNNELATTKNTGKLLAILIAMRMRRCTTRDASPNRAHPGLHSEPLGAAIEQVPALYRPSGCHRGRI
jgi:hypothetical protein